MANLRGGTFEKQARDAFFRLAKFRTSRHNREVKGFVSVNRLKQVKTMLNKFSNYLKAQGYTGKLNEHMSNKQVLRDFAKNEILRVDYAPGTVQEYASLFSKIVENLAHNNITIKEEAISYTKELYKEAKESFRADSYETGRYIENLQYKLSNLYSNNYTSGVIAEVQATMGLRISEAHELVKNFQEYYNPSTGNIEGLIGKANHVYMTKAISQDLVYKIEAIHNNNAPVSSQNAYREDLKEVGINKSHDLRITYAKNLYNNLKEQGYTEKEALKAVSQELNHNRLEITQYYLARA